MWPYLPRWAKRVHLFAVIVWRPWYGGRMDWRTAWAVAFGK